MIPAIPSFVISDILLDQPNTPYSILPQNSSPYQCMAVHDIGLMDDYLSPLIPFNPHCPVVKLVLFYV